MLNWKPHNIFLKVNLNIMKTLASLFATSILSFTFLDQILIHFSSIYSVRATWPFSLPRYDFIYNDTGEVYNLWSSSIRFPLSTSLTIMFLVPMKLLNYIQIKVQTWLQCETFRKRILTHFEYVLVEEQLLLARESDTMHCSS